MNPELIPGIPDPVSHLLFGALGGLLYLLMALMEGKSPRRIEWLARPVVGAIAAFILTVLLALPNHTTSIFVGYFGIDVWQILARRAQSMLNVKLPAAIPEGRSDLPPLPEPGSPDEPHAARPPQE